MPRKEIGNMLDVTNKQNHNDNYKELYDQTYAMNQELSATNTKLANLKEGPQGPVGPMGPQGPKGDKGDRGLTGDTGKAFTYADFTSDQLLGLKGPKGDTGATGPQGAKGDQGIQGIQGPKGDKGDKGDTGLTGPQGPQGIQGLKGDTGAQGPQGIQGPKGDGLQIDGVVATTGELPTGTTKSTYLVGTTLYFRNAGSSTWTAGPNIKGVDGKAGSVVTIGADGYWYIDSVKMSTKADLTSDIVRIQRLVNLLGPYGGFHKDTDGDGLADGSIKSGTNSGLATWSNGQQTFSSNSASFYFKSPPTSNLKDNTCYIAIMDVVSSNTANRSLSEKIQVYGTNAIASSFAYKNEEKVAYTSFKTGTGTSVAEAVFLKYDTATNTYDNLRLYEISQSEFDALSTMSPTQIKTMYPYIESFQIANIENLQSQLDGKALAGHNHDLTYIKIADGQAYKIFNDDGTLKYVSGANLNTPETSFTKSGWYYSANHTNGPAGVVSAGYLSIINRQGLPYSKMVFIPFDSEQFWLRTKNNNVWGAWQKLNVDAYTKQESDGKYALTTHTHSGYAPTSHTHAIADVSGLQTELNGKLTKTQADTLYAPIGSTGSGSTTPVNVLSYVDVVAKFGLKDTSLAENASFDNYDGIKAWADHYNSHSGQRYVVDPSFKEIRSQRFRQVDNEQNTLSTSSDDIYWTGKNNKIIGNGVKFISMPTNGFERGFDYLVGDYYRSKNCHINLFKFSGAENFEIEGLIVDGEAHKITFPTGATQEENANIKYNGKTLAETHGHMAEFTGCKFFTVTNSKFLNASVDCVNISSKMDLATFKATHTDFFSFENCVFSGGGRLSFAMIGGTNFKLSRCEFTNAGTLKNSQGKQIFYSPGMAADFEPHFSEIAGDNDTASKWRADKWNGHAIIEQCYFNNNAGGAVAATSTLLTKFIEFRQNVFKAGSAPKGNYFFINSSLRGCDFINNDFRGLMADGNYAKILPFGAGLVNEQTGVINGDPSNVVTNFIGNEFDKVNLWTNYDTTQTYNDVQAGQYGLHKIHFERNTFKDTLIEYKNRRLFTFLHNLFTFSAADTKITKMLLQNSIFNYNIFKSEKSGTIELDFGSGDKQSVIEHLALQQGKFTIASTSKATKVKSRTDESIDIYYQTPLMDYLLTNSGTSQPSDTTAPNAPTVDPVYNNSTTITGTAEANSTVLFTGGFTGQTTANSSDAYTIVASNLTAGQTITVKAKDAAGNISAGTTVTIQTAQAGTGTNLWPTTAFDFTGKTIPQLGGSGSKYAMNSAYTISNNEAQALNMTGSGDTVTINAVAGTAKYGFFTLEPNTQYTLRIKASDTIANASDLVTMLGGEYIWPNPKVVDITFTTDANGKYGYDFNGVTYGAADATKGLFHRANGGKNSVTTYKLWLNKGATSTSTWSS